MIGIDNLKTVLRFGLSLGNELGRALEDGKFEWTEAAGFLDELLQIQNVIEAAPAVVEELADLSPAEADELTQIAVTEFNIPQDGAEQRVHAALTLAFAIAEYVATWVKK